MRAILAYLTLAFAIVGPAWGYNPPPPNFFPYSHVAIPQQNNIMAWAPYQHTTTTFSSTFNIIGTGRTNVLVAELEGDPVAVQVVLLNTSAAAFALAQAVVSPTAQYSTGTGPGTDPIDANGTRLLTMVPVTWNNGGQNSLPWSGATSNFTGAAATSGRMILPLPLNASVAAGLSSLGFASTVTNAVTGKLQPAIGMFVTDGKGCIAANTTVTSVNSTTIGISKATIGSGCLNNQTIWFSYQPLALGVSVPASTNGLNGPFVYSDWIPVPAFPRTDGGFVAGMAVSCTNCGAGLTVQSVQPHTVTLSGTTSGAVASGTQVTFTETPVTVGAATINQSWFNVSSTSGLQTGQAVTGDASIPANTLVTQVGPGSLVRINAVLTGTLAAGTTLTFTNSAFTNAAQPATNQLQFISTNNKRLFTFRSMAASGAPTGSTVPFNNNGVQQFESGLGMPYSAFYQSATLIDGMNVVNTLQNSGSNAGSTPFSLVYAIRYITRQRGVTVCDFGDSHFAGGGTASGSNAIARLASAQLSTLQRPVSYVNSAIGGQAPAIFGPAAAQWITNGSCNVVVTQYASRNDNAEADQLSYIAPITHLANAAGARTLYVTDFPRAAPQIWNFVVDTAVNNSTTVPLRNFAFGSGWLQAGGSGSLITGAGIPANTTFSYSSGATSMTLSQAATIAAGTVISGGVNLPASTTLNSTAVTLTNPAPITVGAQPVTGANIAANTFIATTINSTAATLSQNATATGATSLTISNAVPTSEPFISILAGDAVSLATQSQPVFDTYFCGMDPANPPQWLPQYTFDGIHGNDNLIASIQNGISGSPGSGCGSFLAALQAVVGN